MEITLERRILHKDFTIGEMCVDGVKETDTIELWIAFRFVFLSSLKQSAKIFSWLCLVVNCFQTCIFEYSETTQQNKDSGRFVKKNRLIQKG